VEGKIQHAKFESLIRRAQAEHPLPLRTAVAHPCDGPSLAAALAAGNAGLIVPILHAPRTKLDRVAAEAGLDLSTVEIIDAAHSHAAAEGAVASIREGRAEALMKGSLHTDELMAAVVSASGGLRTVRRISHCFVLDVPAHAAPLVVSDGAINIAPGLMAKADIVRNAIDLAVALGFNPVRVAILAATETVSEDQPSTLHAAALCKMMERGQLVGALIDGPLALDNAIDPTAARIKGLTSAVAGQANVLIAPDLEAGNMLAKSLSFLAGADAAGIVMGARVPIVLTSRADSSLARLASCAIALLLDLARITGEGA
jgi:phosphate acetyltransferase